MKLTPQQRRNRIYDMAQRDEEYSRMFREYEQAKERFEKFVDKFPLPIRNLLWSYPGMGYLLHNRMISIICEKMEFTDEEETPPQP